MDGLLPFDSSPPTNTTPAILLAMRLHEHRHPALVDTGVRLDDVRDGERAEQADDGNQDHGFGEGDAGLVTDGFEGFFHGFVGVCCGLFMDKGGPVYDTIRTSFAANTSLSIVLYLI